MHMHASCAARDGAGVLLLGPSGSGKSDLLLRLLDRGFDLVADDVVTVEDGEARAPDALAGLLEVRGLGILRVPHSSRARVALAVRVCASADERPERMPLPEAEPALGVPLVRVDPRLASAVPFVVWALDCALGRIGQVAGAFAR